MDWVFTGIPVEAEVGTKSLPVVIRGDEQDTHDVWRNKLLALRLAGV